MTNYQKRLNKISNKEKERYGDKIQGSIAYQSSRYGFNEGYALCLADVQPLVDVVEKLKGEIDVSGLPSDNLFTQLFNQFAHFKTLGGKGE